jgi:putative DNA primase/helicase
MQREISALDFISPLERQTWIRIGMALQSQYGIEARDVWLNWSRQADSFKEKDALAVWKSFKGAGISIATLFHTAKQNGWRDDSKYTPPTPGHREAQRQAALARSTKEGLERLKLAREAAKKAAWIVDQCKYEKHAYLHSKGFAEMEGLVWRPNDTDNLLCIKMYVNGGLAGLQMIDKDGNKKFLSNQITAGAEHVFDAKQHNAIDIWCEGYATGLSLKTCLQAESIPARVHSTFSAQNMKRMAHSGYVIADNDKSGVGEVTAKEIGLPYYMPDAVGMDFNDEHKRLGLFKMGQTIKNWIIQQKKLANEGKYL